MTKTTNNTLIQHQNDIAPYVPPGHEGTVNIRLVGGDFCGAFEMNLGTVEPGGEASSHHHENEHQIIYILDGVADVVLGGDPAVECGAGTIVRIPPKLQHAVYAKGDVPFKALIVYSPPLPPRAEVPVEC